MCSSYNPSIVVVGPMGVFLCARVNRRTEKGVFVFEILGGPFKFSLKVYRAITALLPCSLCVDWLGFDDF